MIYFVHKIVNKQMNRPTSNKLKSNAYWGHSRQEQQQPFNKQIYTRKKVKVIKPDLTTNDFSRILPRKMYQDKERLYSEGLQLRQAYHQISDQNVRLKTQVSVLQKQKDRASRLTQSQERGGGKGREQPNSKMAFHDNKMIKNLKRLLRDYKDENKALLSQNKKIRKTIKYIKTNELEVELKVVIQENERLAAMVAQYSSRLEKNQRLQTQNQDLHIVIEREYENNKKFMEENRNLIKEIQSAEQNFKKQADRWRIKQNKINRQLNNEKRKGMQQLRYIEDLRRQLNLVVQSRNSDSKKKPGKSAHRQYTSAHNPQMTQSQLSKMSQFDKEKGEGGNSKVFAQNQSLLKEIQLLKGELEIVRKQLKKQKQNKKLSSNSLQQYSDSKMQASKNMMKNKISQEQSDINVEAVYVDEFEQPEQIAVSKEFIQKEGDRLLKIKEEFQDKSSEEELYKQDEKVSSKKGGKSSDKKKKKEKEREREREKSSAGGYKANKKVLAEIKELLTYRMKSQRYPFTDLQVDINNSDIAAFNYTDLTEMLLNQPFYLTKTYASLFLKYCYQKQTIGKNQTLDNKILIAKLRKVVDPFTLMEQQKEKEMIIRIAQMVSSYPEELQLAFENIKNGEQTVAKQDMINMFRKLSLQEQYIQLIIAELSLCSEDLEHLNFHGFFQRFYIAEQDMPEEPIEEQEEEDDSRDNSSRIKKEVKKKKDSKKSL